MTHIVHITPDSPEADKIEVMGIFLKQGKTVVFPTETVYGLGANALDAAAVSKIFSAKGRPTDNPLIVHVANKEMLTTVVEEIPQQANVLIEAFWPGPLTLVLKKKESIPQEVSGGLDTVAVRMPKHPVAQAIIQSAGIPIAAPSANISGRPSPTKAQHSIDDLNGKVDAIVDGGDANVGLESTVISIDGEKVTLLRPGSITREQLEDTLGHPIIIADAEAARPVSPGMKYRHYAPDTPFILVEGKDDAERLQKLETLVNESPDKKIAILGTNELREELKNTAINTRILYSTDGSCDYFLLGDRSNLDSVASHIFDFLRMLDKKGYHLLLMCSCNEEGIGMAIMNRLRKAASKRY